MSVYHHPNSPSALWRRALCPGSRLMEEGEPDTAGEAAIEGTMLHGVVADRMNEKYNANELAQEQEEAVETCLEYASGFQGLHLIERHMRLIGSTGKLITEGTPDLIVLVDSTAICIDWKFGRGEVDIASDNMQLAAYSAMVAQRYVEVRRVVAAICAPRQFPKTTDYCFEDFAGITDHIQRVCERTYNDPVLVPGERQCKYCKGAHKCPKLRCQVATVAATVEKLPPLATMPADELAEWMDKIQIVEGWEKKIRKEIQSRLDANVEVPGWKLSKGKRSITADVAELFAVVQEHLTQDEYTACCSVSIPSVKNAIAAKVAANYKTETAAMEYAEAVVLPATRESRGRKLMERVK